MPSRDRDGWVVAGGDRAGSPPRPYQAGHGAANGTPYNGAYQRTGQAAEQTWQAGGRYAEQPYQPRHVGRYPVRPYPPGPYSPGSRPTAPAPARRTATASAPVRASAPAGELADPPRSRLSAVLWTVGFYLVPVVVYLVWAMTLSGDPPVGCVGPDGGACPPPRTAAFTNLAGSALGLAGALFTSAVISLGLGRLASDWRGFTVGFAASVIGAGAVTLFASAIR